MTEQRRWPEWAIIAAWLALILVPLSIDLWLVKPR